MSQRIYSVQIDTKEADQALKGLQGQMRDLQRLLRELGQGSLGGEVGGGENGLSEAIDKASDSSRELLGLMRQLRDVYGGMFALNQMKSFVDEVISVRGEFQQLEVAFNTMLGSKERADALMAQIVDTAARTPFDLQGVAQGAKQLLAYGTASEEVNEKLLMLGDIASGVSAPLGDLVYLYGTTMTQGRMFTQDLRQFQGRGIPLAEELAKQFGVARDEVGKLVSAGKVGAEEFNKAMESLARGRFHNLMAEQSKTITGQISNLQDQIQGVFNELGKASEGVIAGTLSGVGFLLENYQKLGKAILSLIAIYGTYRTAVLITSVTHTLESGAVLSGVSAIRAKVLSLNLATLAQSKFNAVVSANPYVLAGVALMGVVATLWTLSDGLTNAERAQQKFNESLRSEQEESQKARDEAERLLSVLRNSQETNYARNKAYEDLLKIYPSLIGQIKQEELAVMSLTEAQKKLNELKAEGELRSKKDRLEELKLAEEFARIKATEGAGALLRFQKQNPKAREAFEKYVSQGWEDLFTSNKSLYELASEQRKLAEQDLNKVIEQGKSKAQKLSEVETQLLQLEKRKQMLRSQIDASTPRGLGAGEQLIRDNNKNILQKQFDSLTQQEEALKAQRESYRETIQQENKRTIHVVKEELKKEQEAWDALSEAEKRADEKRTDGIASRLKKLQEEQKRHKLTDDPKSKKTAKSQKSKSDAQEKAQQDWHKRELTLQREQEEERIRLMTDGFDKELALIELQHKRRADKRRELEVEMRRSNKAMGKPSDLTQGQSQLLEQDQKQAEEVRLKARQELETKLLERYQSFEQKKLEIAKRYEAERKALEQVGGLSQDEREGVLGRIKKQEAKEIKEVNDAIVQESQKSSQLLIDLFARASEQSAGKLREVIATARELVEYLRATKAEDLTPRFGMSTAELQALQSQPDKLRAVMDALGEKMDALGKARPLESIVMHIEEGVAKIRHASQAIADAKATLARKDATESERKNATEALAKGQAERADGFKKIAKGAQQASAVIQSLGGAVKEAFGVEDDGGLISFITGVTDVATKALTGDIMGAITGGIGVLAGIIGSFTKLSKENRKTEREAQEARLRMQEAYNLALIRQNLEYQRGQTLLGEDKYGKMINSVKVYNDLLKKNREEITAQRKIYFTIPNKRLARLFGEHSYNVKVKATRLEHDLHGIRVADGTRKVAGGFLGLGTKSVDHYKSLLDVFPDLISKEKELNLERAEAVLQTRKMNNEDKARLQNIVNTEKEIRKAKEQMQSYMTNIFGGLGSKLSDSLVEAFKRGEGAAGAFRRSVGEMFEKLAQDMAYNAILAPAIEKASKEIGDIYMQNGNEEDKMERSARILGNLLGQMDGLQEQYYSLLERSEKIASRHKIDTLRQASDERTSSASRGLAQASQDSIDTLVGLHYTEVALLEKQLKVAISGAGAFDRLGEVGDKCLVELRAINASTARTALSLQDIQTNGLILRR